MPYLAFFCFLLGLGLVGLVLWFNRKNWQSGGAKHLSLALSGLFYSWWAFCSIFTYGLDDMALALVWYQTAQFGAIMMLPCSFWFLLEVGEVRLSTRWWLIGPLVAFSGFAHWQFRQTGFYFVAFQPGPWGNVGVPGPVNGFLVLTFTVFLLWNAGTVALMLYKSFRAPSRRLKRQYAINALGLVSTFFVDAASLTLQSLLDWPRMDLFEVGFYLFGVNFYLIGRYRFLLKDQPMTGWHVGNVLKDPVLILDSRLKITSANPVAREWLATIGITEVPVGQSFPEIFPIPEDFSKAWESLRVRATPQQTIVTQTGGRTVFIGLSAEFDSLGDIIGAVALLSFPEVSKNAPLSDYGLSEREYEVVLMLLQGKVNKEIAHALFISPGTVKNHIYSIYKKTGATTRLGLIQKFRPQ